MVHHSLAWPPFLLPKRLSNSRSVPTAPSGAPGETSAILCHPSTASLGDVLTEAHHSAQVAIDSSMEACLVHPLPTFLGLTEQSPFGDRGGSPKARTGSLPILDKNERLGNRKHNPSCMSPMIRCHQRDLGPCCSCCYCSFGKE